MINKKINDLRMIRLAKFLGATTYKSAQHILSRMILFDLVQKTNQDNCYGCKEKILNYKELSIEHMKPWESRDPALFWDLDNIAFSHTVCNKPHKGSSDYKIKMRKERRRIIPSGKAWCYRCKQFLPQDNFYKSKFTWHGFNSECKNCNKGRKRGLIK